MKLEATNLKVNSDWREVKDFIWYVKWKEAEIKAKVNPEWDIWEYVSWVPNELIGEQLFTYDALCRLELEKRLPSFEDIKDLKDINLAGYWLPDNEIFYGIGVRSYVWLAGGYIAYFGQNEWYRYNDNRDYGFSGRLLKELDTSSIWLFEKIVDWAERYWAKLWASAWYELGKLLDK